MDRQLTLEEYLRIEAYLLGNLDVEAKIAFELDLSNDPWLQAEVEAYQALQGGIEQFHTRQVLTDFSHKLEAEGFFLDEQSIEQHYLGELPAEMIPIFEKKRDTDPVFAQKIVEFEAMIQGMKNFQESVEIKSRLTKIEAELGLVESPDIPSKTQESGASPEPPLPSEAPPVRRKLFYRLSMAASLAVLVGVCIWLFVDEPFANPGRDLIDRSLPEEILLPGVMQSIAKRGYDPDDPNLVYDAVQLDTALQYYQQSAMDSAHQRLERYINENPKDNNGQFYYGVLSVHVKKYKTAEKAFETVLQSPNSKYYAAADWYLAVAQFQTNPELGTQHIIAIANGKASTYRELAKKMVKRYSFK